MFHYTEHGGAMKQAKAKRGPEKRDAVAKTFDVLWFLVEDLGDRGGRAWGVRELAQKLGFSPATVHRSLAGLMRHGFIQQSGTAGKYSIGMELYRLALKVQPHVALRNAAMPVLQELVAKCNEAAFLGFYDASRLQMMFVAVINSSHPLRYVVPLNEWIPVHAGASGLAVMAFLPEPERRAIVERRGLPRITEATITDPQVLEDELAKVRRRGYALSRGQRTKGAVAIAAPIWGPNGYIVGELNLSVPEPRFDESMTAAYAKLVITHAQRITANLGGQPPSENGTRGASV
jgi:DNA-binding IclR family transcriptional regulator